MMVSIFAALFSMFSGFTHLDSGHALPAIVRPSSGHALPAVQRHTDSGHALPAIVRAGF